MVHFSSPVLTFEESYCSTVHNSAWKNQNKTALELLYKIIFNHRFSVRTDIQLFIPQKQSAEGAGLSKYMIFQLSCQTRAFKETVYINHPFVPLLQNRRLVKTLFGTLALKTTKSQALCSWGRGNRGGSSEWKSFVPSRVDRLPVKGLTHVEDFKFLFMCKGW